MLELCIRAEQLTPLQPIGSRFARTDKLDMAGETECVELTLAGLETTTKLSGDVVERIFPD
jgi:hypothetical protein